LKLKTEGSIMTTESTNLEDQNLDYDAEQMKEAIAAEETPAPTVNVEKDYEKSKQFSTPEHEMDAAEISPSLGSSFNPENKQAEISAEGNPEKFREMAHKVSPEADD
jgi:hypothetical protein